MASVRLLLVRGSVVLNAALVLYLCLSWLSAPSTDALRKPRYSFQHYRTLEAVVEDTGGDLALAERVVKFSQPEVVANQAQYVNNSPNELTLVERENNAIDVGEEISENLGNPERISNMFDGRENYHEYKANEEKDALALAEMKQEIENSEKKDVYPKDHQDDDPHLQEPPREVQESVGVVEDLVAAVIATEAPDPPLDSLEKKMYPDLRGCATRPQMPFYSQRGLYWVLENYIPAALSFRCDESVTYTTHGDYTFLDNLDTLTSRWQGPVSISVYAPGKDFEHSINTILYLRECWAEGIKKYVTFHLIYHTDHVPAKIPSTEDLMQRKPDCGGEPPKWVNVTTYRQKKKLLYPVNVARNVARRASQTYFVFPSDVELYPSTNFIPEFFKMLKKPDFSDTTLPKVFVFSIFEVKESVSVPENKQELLAMLGKGDAIPFHKKVCAKCHDVPHSKEWLQGPVKPGLEVVHVGKRLEKYKKWEPIYVGTHREPLYDERLSWEGKSDKMTQMYILCVRDYEFLVLDNAFLVHRPGIKHNKRDAARDKLVLAQNTLIQKHILPEYRILFGSKKECTV